MNFLYLKKLNIKKRKNTTCGVKKYNNIYSTTIKEDIYFFERDEEFEYIKK